MSLFVSRPRSDFRRRTRHVLTAVAAAVLASQSPSHAQSFTWTGAGATPAWNNPANWSPAGVPPSAGAATFTLDAAPAAPSFSAPATIRELTNTATFTLSGGNRLTLNSTLNNSGTVTLTPAANRNQANLVLNPTAPNQTLTYTGGGTVALTEHLTSILLFNTLQVPNTTIINENNTIRGSGSIFPYYSSASPGKFINRGTISADVPGQRLDFATVPSISPATPVFNTGLLQAVNGGTLNIISNAIDNTGGIGRVAAGSTIAMTGTWTGGRVEVLNGGTFSFEGVLTNLALVTSGNAYLRSLSPDGLPGSGGSITLSKVTLSGDVTIGDSAWTFTDSLRNANTITVADERATGGTSLVIAAADTTTPTRLFGGGTINLTRQVDSRVFLGGNTFINEDNFIHGAGRIGGQSPNSLVINRATISADRPNASLTINLIGLENTGTLEARNAATLVLATEVDNSAGTLELLDQATAVIRGPFTGGRVLTSPDSTIEVRALFAPGTIDDANLHVVSGTFRPPLDTAPVCIKTLAVDVGGTLSLPVRPPSRNLPGPLQITGNADLSGTLSLRFDPDFSLPLAQSMLLIDIAGTRTGTFNLEEGAPLFLPGTSADTDDPYYFITFTAGDGNDVAIYAIPEPAALTMLLAVPVALRRRR